MIGRRPPRSLGGTNNEESSVGMVVLLVARRVGGISVEPESLRGLAALGVTNVALVRDEESDGVVLEGWAFDASRATEAIAVLDAVSARALPAVTLMAIPPMNKRGIG